MKRDSTPSFGALHPVLFFIMVYGISLFMAIFVCRMVYNSIHEDPSVLSKTIGNELSGATASR